MLSFSFSFFLSVHPSFVGSLVLYVWRIELNEMNAAVLTDERFIVVVSRPHIGILVGGFDGFFLANNDQNDDTTNAPNELNQIKFARATVSVFHAYAAVCVLQVVFTHVLLESSCMLSFSFSFSFF